MSDDETPAPAAAAADNGNGNTRGRKKKKKKKEDADAERPRHVHVEPTDPEFAKWIASMWKGGEYAAPRQMRLVQAYKGGKVLGHTVDTVPFKANEPMNIERAAELSNLLLAAAQLDCDRVVRRPQGQSYYVLACDPAKTAEAENTYRRYPLFCKPKTTYLASPEAVRDGDDEEDGLLDQQALNLRYAKLNQEQAQFDKINNNTIVGDVLIVLRDELRERRLHEARLMAFTDKVINGRWDDFEKVQGALDRGVDREQARQWTAFKLKLATDGYRSVRNWGTSWFGGNGGGGGEATGGESSGNAGGNGNGNGNGGNGQARTYPKTKESNLVDNFLHDAEDEGVAEVLFGVWGDKGNVTPGIFTPRQCAILDYVRQCKLPAEALDQLMPGSGKPDMITPEQFDKASPHITEGMGTALLEISNIRKEAKAARAQQATQPKPPPEEEGQDHG